MDFWLLVLDIVILLTLALLAGSVLERFKQSAILGYLAAGAVLGPGAFNLISAGEAVSAMAELGVALLLFTIGLEFSWSRLRKLGAIALGGGTLQIIVTALMTAAMAMLLGLTPLVAVALGVMIAPSSTACVLRILVSRAEIDSVHGRNALGILLLQDIALVPLVLIMTILGGKGGISVIAWEIGKAIVLSVLFFGSLYLLINYAISRLLDLSFAARNRELPVLLAATICLGSSWLAHSFGLSPALGAFAAGLLLAESPFATQIRADIGGLKTLFVALFFVSIGMLADLSFVSAEWPAIAAIVTAIVIGKPLIIWGVARVFRQSHRNAIATGVSLGQVGEFSFVLAQIGFSVGVIDSKLFQLLVSATVVTLFLSPLLVAAAPRVGNWVENRLTMIGLAGTAETISSEMTATLARHVIVVGMGPSGRGVIEALGRNGIPMIVVDLNAAAVEAAKRQGMHAMTGDASQEEILDHLQVKSSRAVVVTIPDHSAALQVIRQVHALAPDTFIIARARYHMHAEDLELAGARVVIDEELLMGRSLGVEVLRHMKPDFDKTSHESLNFPPLI